jgi:tRNA 2-thiocytidine biosynthesis protein TtcA
MNIQEIERSIIKTYRKELWSPFIKAIKEYELVNEGDHVAVCISGGKDSLLLAKLFQELHKHSNISFQVSYISMNPGFDDYNLTGLYKNCELMGINIQVFQSNVFEVAEKLGKEYPCYLCARMRRGFLYNAAKELGCNKIALGHHMDDVIETTLLNIFYASNYKTMLPKLKSTNFSGMELIRPMVYIKEEHITKFIEHAEIVPMNCGCTIACKVTPSKRREIKNLISNLRKVFPDVDKSIFNSAKNVNLNCVLGWKHKDTKYNYLDFYKDLEIDEENE